MRTVALVAALLTTPFTAAIAQSCIGIAGESRGFLAYGVSGTDAATGDAVTFGYRASRASILVNRTSLSGIYVDRMNSWSAHVTLPVQRSVFCIVSGLERTGYGTKHKDGWYLVGPDGNTIHHLGGKYAMFSVPLLLQAGRVYQLFDLGVQPFAVAGPVVQWELFMPLAAPATERTVIATRLGVGLNLQAGWLVIRSTLSTDSGPDYTLAGRHNFATIHVKAGVRF